MNKIILLLTIFFLFFNPKNAKAINPVGYLDTHPDGSNCNQLVGWAGDPDNPNLPVKIHFYADAPAGSGKFLGETLASEQRPQAVCSALGGQNCGVCPSDSAQCKHGFAFTVPWSLKDRQNHLIYAYALNLENTTGGNSALSNTLDPLVYKCPKLNPGFGDGTISKSVNGSPVTVKTANWVAGAIDSLTYRGKEYVYSAENGQQIQVALTVNNYGECYNPTESGGSLDGYGPTTTSVLKSFSASGNTLESTTQMAFWFPPSTTGWRNTCIFDKTVGGLWKGGYVLTTSPLSNFILHKKVTIGYQDLDNVIEYAFDLTVPSDLKINAENLFQSIGTRSNPFNYFILENPAVYIQPEFSSKKLYDPSLPSIKESLKVPMGYSIYDLPPIIYTEDEQHAVGLFTPEMTKNRFPNNEQNPYLGYEVYDWRNVFSGHSTMMIASRLPKPAQNGSFKSFIIVGTLSEVQLSMNKLYAKFYPSGNLDNIGGVDIFDLRHFLTNFLQSLTIFDYNKMVENFGR